jgi:hypothetical protein
MWHRHSCLCAFTVPAPVDQPNATTQTLSFRTERADAFFFGSRSEVLCAIARFLRDESAFLLDRGDVRRTQPTARRDFGFAVSGIERNGRTDKSGYVSDTKLRILRSVARAAPEQR